MLKCLQFDLDLTHEKAKKTVHLCEAVPESAMSVKR